MSDRAFQSVLLALILCAAAPLYAGDVDRGIDLWKTLPGSGTKDHLQIPGGFFNTGSDPVNAWVHFKGSSLATKPGTPSLGNADTVLERLADAHPVTCGAADQVGLRIAALHLVGEETVTVRYGGSSPEEWTVEAYLSDAEQAADGSITIRQNCDGGGTFESSFTVRPKLIFTRTSDGLHRILDWKVLADRDAVPEIPFHAEGDWARHGPDGFGLTTAEAGAVVDANHDGSWDQSPLPGSTSDFVVGAKVQSCSCARTSSNDATNDAIGGALLLENSLLANHAVDPPTYDRASFPLQRQRDRPVDPAVRATELAVPRFLAFIPLTLLAFAAVAAVPWRHDK